MTTTAAATAADAMAIGAPRNGLRAASRRPTMLVDVAPRSETVRGGERFVDASRVDLLLKYILAVAGQQDRGNRELGPIHLVKYVYLADLAHAERHAGETFTGASWRFHHFGPWCQDVFARIEPVVREVGAAERIFSHPSSDDDRKRWALDDEDVLQEVQPKVPLEVAGPLRRWIREHAADTRELLRLVYTTRPMLRAKPGDMLEFSAAVATPPPTPPPEEQPLSASARRRRCARLDAIRDELKRRLAERQRPARAPDPPPRYDEVFIEGQRWLDSLAGEPLAEGSGDLIVDDALWAARAADADTEVP